jgi:hypothetical protein
MITQRKVIEDYVTKHPTLKKVSAHISKRYNMREDIVYEKFITFLMKEVDCIGEKNILHGLKCFEFSESTKEFVNRTIFSSYSYSVKNK